MHWNHPNSVSCLQLCMLRLLSTWPRSSRRTQTHTVPIAASSPNTLAIPRLLPSATQLSRWIKFPGCCCHRLDSPAADTRRRLQARPRQVNMFVCLLPPGSIDTARRITVRRNTLLLTCSVSVHHPLQTGCVSLLIIPNLGLQLIFHDFAPLFFHSFISIFIFCPTCLYLCMIIPLLELYSTLSL